VRGLADSLAPLRLREFRLLFTGQLISAVGDALIPVALTFAVLDLTGSASDLGLVFAAFMGSRVVFIVVGGVWSDRLPRQLVMIAADLVRLAVQAIVAVTFFLDAARVWQLVVASAVAGAATAFFGPASTGLVKQLVPAERLQEANALTGLSQSAIYVFGPALSGVLVATLDFGVVFAIDAATYLASVLFLVAMRMPAVIALAQERSFLGDVRRGLREIGSRRWLWASFVTFSISNVTIATYFVLGPLVVAEELGGARDWGLMLTGGAIGGLVGGAVALRWKPRRPLVPGFAVMAFVSLQLLALVPPLPLPALMLASLAAVAAIAIGNAFWDTMLQQHIPAAAISRVSSLDWAISLVFMPLGYLLAGPLAEAVGVTTALLLAAGAGLAANVGILLVPDIRRLERVEGDGTAGVEPAVAPVAAAP